MTLKGARLIVNITASPSGPEKPYFLVQQTGCRATENFVYAASANLVGKDRSKYFYGTSSVCGPIGARLAAVLAKGSQEEEIVSTTLNFERLHRWFAIL